MSTITAKAVAAQRIMKGPYGNWSAIEAKFETNASGVMVGSDLATAVQNGDTVVLAILPKGMTLWDAQEVISDAFAASTTSTLGFLYVDGVDDTGVPQNSSYFKAAASTASVAVTRKTATNKPVRLPKEAYLVAVIGGANHSAAGRMDVLVEGFLLGD
jgi:hypothetical protein